MLQLQQTAGNQAVQQLLSTGVIQRKMSTQNTVAELNLSKSPDETLIRPGSSGQPLDEQTRDFMESRFGRDFSAVQIHADEKAAASARILDADAYTTGRDIYFASGKYAPTSSEGRHLIAHELTHTLQQREASGALARASEHRSGVVIGREDDPLEREAEQTAEQVIAGANAHSALSSQFTAKNLVQARPAQGPIQRKSNEKPIYVPYQIHVNKPMTRQEFQAAAMRQIFGGMLKSVQWLNVKDSYVPENSPYTVQVDIRVLKQQRGEIRKERGISVGQEGGVIGEEERAKTFHAEPESEEKSALMKEIDRRYFEAIGEPTET